MVLTICICVNESFVINLNENKNKANGTQIAYKNIKQKQIFQKHI